MRNTIRVSRASAVLGLAMTMMAAGSLTGCGGGGSPATDSGVTDASPDARGDATPDDGGGDAGCTSSTACTDTATPICRSGACAACLTDAECSSETGLAICLDDGSCAACGRDTDCEGGFCLTGGVCAQCRGNEDCGATAPLCSAGACVSCGAAEGCTRAMLRDEWLAALCAVLLPSEEESVIFHSMEAAICSGRGDVFPAIGVLTAGIESGQIQVNAAGLAACRAAAGSADAFQTCVDALEGQVAPGGDCFSDVACAGGRCDRSATCPSVCVADPGEGESCATAPCASGLSCIMDVCRPIPGDGEACSGRCTDGLLCNHTSNVCEPLHALAAACLVSSDCEPSLRCVGDVCVARAAGGEACRADLGSVECADGLRCVADVCRTPKADGEACTAPRQCHVGSRCQAGVCRTILTPGRACDVDSACALGAPCTLGACSPAPDVGESCADAGTCLRGGCVDGTCTELLAFTSCTAGVFLMDALDPCGAASSCRTTPSGDQCVPEGNVGADCTGAVPCREPDLTCGSAGRCEATCAP